MFAIRRRGVRPERINGLTDIPEASGQTIRWRISDTIAVEEFQY